MAGPVYTTIGARSTSAGATTLTPAKPTVSGLGGTMLAVCQTDNNDTHSTATPGWSLIAQVNSGANFTASLWIADEGAAAPVFTWTGSVPAAAQVAYYSSVSVTIDDAIGNSSTNSGTGATHSTAGFNSTRDESLAVYVDCAAANTALATPAGWTENSDGGSATDSGQTTWGSKAIATSGSASGAISVTGANADWVQFQVELKASVATGLEVTKAEMGVILDLPHGLNVSKAEFGVILDQVLGLEVSKMEFGVILDKEPGGRRRLGSFF